MEVGVCTFVCVFLYVVVLSTRMPESCGSKVNGGWIGGVDDGTRMGCVKNERQTNAMSALALSIQVRSKERCPSPTHVLVLLHTHTVLSHIYTFMPAHFQMVEQNRNASTLHRGWVFCAVDMNYDGRHCGRRRGEEHIYHIYVHWIAMHDRVSCTMRRRERRIGVRFWYVRFGAMRSGSIWWTWYEYKCTHISFSLSLSVPFLTHNRPLGNSPLTGGKGMCKLV